MVRAITAQVRNYSSLVLDPTPTLTCGSMERWGAFVDKHKRFVLDKPIFSSIIYILYEGVRLRPLIVNT
jgi:hypothetical protein